MAKQPDIRLDKQHTDAGATPKIVRVSQHNQSPNRAAGYYISVCGASPLDGHWFKTEAKYHLFGRYLIIGSRVHTPQGIEHTFSNPRGHRIDVAARVAWADARKRIEEDCTEIMSVGHVRAYPRVTGEGYAVRFYLPKNAGELPVGTKQGHLHYTSVKVGDKSIRYCFLGLPLT